MAASKQKKVVKRSGGGPGEQGRREIIGVCLVALGLFLAASMYTDAVGLVGRSVSEFCFGLCGVAGYAIAALLFVCGVLSIAVSKAEFSSSAYLFAFLAFVCALVLLHTHFRDSVDNVKLFAYYSDAYTFGAVFKKGGGLLGALLAYPSLLLLGKVGTTIFFAAALLIFFLLITRISLRAAGEKVGRSIKSGVEAVSEHVAHPRAPLYQEDLEPVLKQEPQKRRASDAPRKVIRRVSEPSILSDDAVESKAARLNMFPTSGAIPTRAPDADAFDPFAGLEQTPPGEIHLPAEEERVSRISDRAPAAAKPIPVTAPPEEPAPRIIEYQRPPYTLLTPLGAKGRGKAAESPSAKAALLVETLASFNISARVTNVSVGPVITRFELQPAQGVRVNRITTLSDDIALALAAPTVRIEAPIPGKSAIGIEIPNKESTSVLLRELVEAPEFTGMKSPLAFALGKDIAGNVVCADLEKMPHMLVAGTTGSGKSVCINDIIISMIYHATPSEVRMIMIDPKQVELNVYAPLPHLLLPVVTDAKRAAGALKWAVLEMDKRYNAMKLVKARDIERFNSLQTEESEKMPRLVVIIDELADLMMVAAKEVEDSICRIAQLGRACGIHLIVATQRPSADIITGLIKANIPSRIALMVSSAVDSRVIMDCNGAEKLLGKGDMLFHANGASKPLRAQSAFVSDEEVERLMEFFEKQDFTAEPLADVSLEAVEASGAGAQGNGKQEDELLAEAVRIVMESGQASISMIQRRLRVGYARAARLIDIMEQHKIVSGFDGSKPRKLLIGPAEYEQMFGGEAHE